jgi:hypothetical protein
MSKVLLLGSITKDTIHIEDMHKSSIGGSVYYAAEAFNQFGDDVTLIPIISGDNKRLLTGIHKGIKQHPVFVSSTFTFENIYSGKDVFDRKQRIVERVKDTIEEHHIKDIGFAAFKLIFLGPQSNFDVPLDILCSVHKQNRNICLYSQGYFRHMSRTYVKSAEWDKASLYLKRIRTLILSEKHLSLLSKDQDPKKALKKVSRLGPEEIILSRGKQGFLIYSKDTDELHNAQYFNTEGFINPNGLTSTFSAVYLSMRLEGFSVKQASDYGITAAYVKMNNWLPLRKSRRQIEDIMSIRKVLPRL